MATYRLSSRFNQDVECDIMYYKDIRIFHFIDRATRWHATALITSREEPNLLDQVFDIWIKHHGAPENLYVDGETGLTTDYVKGILAHEGCKLCVRAPRQHARHIERRGAMLRLSMHCTEDQLKKELIKYTYIMLLAMCTFAGNALTYVGGHTPYQICLLYTSPSPRD